MASRFAFPRLGDLSFGQPGSEAAAGRLAIMLPALLAAAMLVIGFTIADIAGIDGSGLFAPYLSVSFAFTLLSLLAYAFIAFALLARAKADNPIPRVAGDLAAKAPILLLPALVFPLFLVGFTTAKTAIPFLVGYEWEAFWADADKLLLGEDAWRITHAWLGTDSMRAWELLYSATWGAALMVYMANIALYARTRTVGVVYTAMLATWLIGGWLMAYATSAAGPIFAHLVDPSLADRFAPLRAALDASLQPDGSTRFTQIYLAEAIDSTIAVKGGGISAMPSMHIAAVSIYVLSARGTTWLWPAIAYWLVIFIGSAHLGYHYWVDGLAAALIAWVCWKFAEQCFRQKADAVRQPI